MAESIIVRIVADATGVQRGTTEAQGILSRGMGKMESLTGLGYAAMGTAAVAFAASSVKAAADAEAAQAKLADAYKRFPAIHDVTLRDLNELAEAQMNRSRFDDDATRAAIAQLAQYNLTGQQIEKLIPLVVDLAAKTGQDVPEAAKQLGLALLGNSRGLKGVGADLELTGDTATNFGLIVDALGEKVKGFAETDLETANGKLAAMKVQMDELKEKVGAELIPAMTELVDALMPVIEATGWVIEKYGQWRSALDELTGPLGSFARLLGGNIVQVLQEARVQFGKTGEMIGALGGWISDALGPIGHMVGALGGLADAASHAWSMMRKIGDLPGSIGRAISGLNPLGVAPQGYGPPAPVLSSSSSAARTAPSTQAANPTAAPTIQLVIHGNVGDEALIGRRVVAALEAYTRTSGQRRLQRLVGPAT